MVRQLRRALAELDTSLTIDSRTFHGGDPLESMIRAAIDRSSGVLVLVSPAGRTDQSHGAALPRATRALAARQRRNCRCAGCRRRYANARWCSASSMARSTSACCGT
ncbi:hypothetical protein E4Q08_08800 [Candidatus Accumulibacter phosphatis]|uniref:TIR domain-containing protein n=1 Tax=Candidatus Accumulibacter contiguus TaxID=2954381 RepID=A0ABX1T6T6_9PROT|nr:hypothetical protein [Candidatus Accumulibacter contiguus]